MRGWGNLENHVSIWAVIQSIKKNNSKKKRLENLTSKNIFIVRSLHLLLFLWPLLSKLFVLRAMLGSQKHYCVIMLDL